MTSGKLILVIHFASWSGNYNKTKTLVKDLYNKWNATEKQIEVLIISGDHNEEEYKESIKDCPFVFVPYANCKAVKKAVDPKIKCTGYPSYGILNAKTGAVISDNAFA